ncbi:hypothetical protein [Amycolatopsis aidingensis]|uniref:hypothetical protein n=1 Tax=Amycolatopsis aidingensis TaxID=2842453 RepID=UPI001C0CE962|nr:hypothetical protein [Amycolatopsis aidingensis]
MTVPRPRPTKVSYDYPLGGLDPFDLDEPRTQHLYDVGGWSRAWVAGEPWQQECRAVHDALPVGYKALSLLEKLAVVVNGVVLREWPETSHSADGLRRLVDYSQRSVVRRETWMFPYRLVRQAGGGTSGFDSYEDAIATAVRPRPQPATVLVCRVLAHRQAH